MFYVVPRIQNFKDGGPLLWKHAVTEVLQCLALTFLGLNITVHVISFLEPSN